MHSVGRLVVPIIPSHPCYIPKFPFRVIAMCPLLPWILSGPPKTCTSLDGFHWICNRIWLLCVDYSQKHEAAKVRWMSFGRWSMSAFFYLLVLSFCLWRRRGWWVGCTRQGNKLHRHIWPSLILSLTPKLLYVCIATKIGQEVEKKHPADAEYHTCFYFSRFMLRHPRAQEACTEKGEYGREGEFNNLTNLAIM